MNKSQLVKTVSESTDSSRQTVEDVVDVLFETIVAEVRSGRKVTVVGFGAFNPIARGPRVGRNPRTGAVVPIPASKGVRFATGSAFKSALNPKEGVSMAVKKAAKRAVRKAVSYTHLDVYKRQCRWCPRSGRTARDRSPGGRWPPTSPRSGSR